MDNIIKANNNHEYTTHDLVKTLTDIYRKPQNKYSLGKLFDELAIGILRQSKIVTSNNQYYIREIEFYYYDENIHPDTYTHKNKRQAEFGEWYFHRFSTVESFLKTNRNGVDITFGNKKNNQFGGILIRKIEDSKTGELIEGINKVAKELIKSVGNEHLDSLAIGCGQKVFDKKSLLRLEVEGRNSKNAIYKVRRNGLSIKEGEVAKEYYDIPYCYFNHTINVPILVKPAI